MRLRLGIGVLALALGAGGVYLLPRPAERMPVAVVETKPMPAVTPPVVVTAVPAPVPEAFVDEVIESIVVERPVRETNEEMLTFQGAGSLNEQTERVSLNVRAQPALPVRPDADVPVRMPYADEGETIPITTVANLPTEAEEADAPPTTPQTAEPPPVSREMNDYHSMHMHCPYPGYGPCPRR